MLESGVGGWGDLISNLNLGDAFVSANIFGQERQMCVTTGWILQLLLQLPDTNTPSVRWNITETSAPAIRVGWFARFGPSETGAMTVTARLTLKQLKAIADKMRVAEVVDAEALPLGVHASWSWLASWQPYWRDKFWRASLVEDVCVQCLECVWLHRSVWKRLDRRIKRHRLSCKDRVKML